jgi:hypothetical protein
LDAPHVKKTEPISNAAMIPPKQASRVLRSPTLGSPEECTAQTSHILPTVPPKNLRAPCHHTHHPRHIQSYCECRCPGRSSMALRIYIAAQSMLYLSRQTFPLILHTIHRAVFQQMTSGGRIRWVRALRAELSGGGTVSQGTTPHDHRGRSLQLKAT